jgi:hypothetical protein
MNPTRLSVGLRPAAALAACIAAMAACTTTSSGLTAVAGCAPERSTTELVAYVPPTTCAGADDGGADGGACPDDFPPEGDQGSRAVEPLSSPFCQRHCAQFTSLVFTGCALSPLTDGGGKIVDCIPAGCD